MPGSILALLLPPPVALGDAEKVQARGATSEFAARGLCAAYDLGLCPRSGRMAVPAHNMVAQADGPSGYARSTRLSVPDRLGSAKLARAKARIGLLRNNNAAARVDVERSQFVPLIMALAVACAAKAA